MARIVPRLFLLFLTALVFQGCFRYTPTRREMAEEGSSKIAGPEAFQAHQSEMAQRLESLLRERADLSSSSNSSPSYKIGAKDVLRVDVFGFSDLSGETEVGENGSISLPLLGSVRAAGLTLTELQTDLTARYKRYVKQPVVRLTVNSFNAHRASVVGAVVRPGMIPLKRPGYPLTELLSEAGGLRDGAGARVYLIPARTSSGLEDQGPYVSPENRKGGVEIDLEQLVGSLERAPLVVPILPGDTIIVPEAGQVRIEGEVERPGSVPVAKKFTTLGAIAAAGGPTYAANVQEVEVIRDIGSGKKASMTVDIEKVAFQGEPDISLRDGDVVVVPSSPGRFRARQVVEGIRTIMRGGVSGQIRYQ